MDLFLKFRKGEEESFESLSSEREEWR